MSRYATHGVTVFFKTTGPVSQLVRNWTMGDTSLQVHSLCAMLPMFHYLSFPLGNVYFNQNIMLADR